MRFSPLLSLVLLAGCMTRPGEPVLSEVNPSLMNATEGGPLELRGEGFLPAGAYDFDLPARSPLRTAVSAWLEQGGQRVELLDATWVDARLVQARVPAGTAPGSWAVHLVTPRGVEVRRADALRLEPWLADGGQLDGGLADGGDLDGGIDAGPQPCQTLTFFDDDGDGFGAPDSGALLCGPGRALLDGDCNDVDPLTAPSGTEVCNQLDDDCDGAVDEGCADGGFTRLLELDALTNDFLSVSTWGPEQLWIAGGARLFVHPGDAGFIDVSANCPMGMNAVWADATGRAFVAGGNNGVGRLTTATRAAGCATSPLLPEPVAGMVGFPRADGGVQLEVVMRDGRRVSWDGVRPVEVQGEELSGVELVDAHGATPAALYAVGSRGTPPRPAVFRLRPDGTFAAEALPAQLPDGSLRGVWAVSATEVVAVGDQGLVLRRVHGAWVQVPLPGAVNATAVRAFSVGRFSVSTEAGTLLQWNGAWAVRATAPLPLRDLAAVDEEHLWLVGDHGLIIKGPLLP